MSRFLALALLLVPLAAVADPPHAIVEVKPGDTTFARLYEVDAFAVADPSIATVERLPTEEFLITGKKAGTTSLAALCSGKVVGIRIHVRAPSFAPKPDGQKELDAVLKACPSHQHVGEGESEELAASPSTPACRTALQALFATDRFTVKQIAVNFDENSLQTQLADMVQAVKAAGITGVELHYQGATLVLKGALSVEDAGKLAVIIYTHALGGVPIDDDELDLSLPDGGSPMDSMPVQILRGPPSR